jgi:methionine-rich copper-binding protein CopC/putative copper export protein
MSAGVCTHKQDPALSRYANFRFKRFRRVVAVVVLSVLGFGANPVMAHIDVDEFTPETGTVLPTTPDTLTIRFSNEPDPGAVEISLSHRDGTPVPFTGDGPQFDGRIVTLTPPALDYGTYVLVWRSVGSDGHIAAGQSYFSVGQPDGGPINDLTPKTGSLGTLADTATRLALYAVLGAWLGMLWLTRRGLFATGSPFLHRNLALGLAALVTLRLIVVSARAGAGAGVLYGLGRIVTTMPTVVGWLLLVIVVASLFAMRGGLPVVAALIAFAVGETLTGHMGTALLPGLLVPLTVVHLLGATFWAGALVMFLLAGRRDAYRAFMRAFTLPATIAVALIATSGIALTVVRTNAASVSAVLAFLEYRYGQILAAKWALVLLGVAPIAFYHAVHGLLPRLRKLLSENDTTGADSTALPAATNTDETGDGRLRRSFAFEGALLLLAVVMGSSLAGLSPVKEATVGNLTVEVGSDLLATPKTFAECMDPSSATDQLLCANRYFEGVVNRDGMRIALQEVSRRWQEGDPWMQTNCHSIGHKLGRMGFKIHQDIVEAFKAGSDPCDYGYLHGVIEGASADFSDAKLREEMPNLCEGTGDTTNHGYRQCIHGLGHAAARRVNNDLVRGMDFCRVFHIPEDFSNDNDPTSESTAEVIFRLCVTGVSMEWNTQRTALDSMTLPIGHPDTLMGQCVNLDPIFHTGCIEYGTSAMGGLPEREIEARDWCDKNLPNPLPCYQSIGRDVIWSPHITPELAMGICTGGRLGIYAQECITRALGSVATIALDASAIDGFCPVVPAEYQHLCAIVRDSMVIQLEQTLRGFIVEPGMNTDLQSQG